MSLVEDVYGARKAAEVMESTWGHLRPDAGRHEGHLIAAFSAYGGERLLVAAEFSDVPDSPWLYDAMYGLIYDADMEEGHVYRFTGSVVAAGTELKFDGEWSRVELDAQGGAS